MKFSLVLRLGEAVYETASPVPRAEAPVVMRGPAETRSLIEKTDVSVIPQVWWVEALDKLRRFDELKMANSDKAHGVGQWLGGLIRGAAYCSGEDHEVLLAKLREQVGPPTPPPVEAVGVYDDEGEIPVISWPDESRAKPPGSFDDMASRRPSPE